MGGKRASKTVTFPADFVDSLDAFLEEHGEDLDYRGRVDYLISAARRQREADEARLLRMRALREGADWRGLD